MRAPGMSMEKLPLFVWSVFITAWQLLLSQPVLAGIYSALFKIKNLNINPTICWNILNEGQSAIIGLNQWTLKDIVSFKGHDSLDSFSCKIFDKEIFRDFTSEQTLLSLNQPSYFTGYYEGDGYIYVPKKDITKEGTQLYPQFQMTFPKKDLPYIYILSTLFNKCSIITKKSSIKKHNNYVLTVSTIKDMLIIYKQQNGNVKTETKYEQLKNLEGYLKIKHKIQNLKPLNAEHQDSNHWLAGFIEADGNFYVRTTKTGKRIRIGFEFSICQHIKNKKIMEEIANYLNVNTRNIQQKNQKRVTTTSFNSVENLFNYQERYPFYGSKWNDFLDFKEGYLQYRNNERLNISEKRAALIAQKKNMNSNRTIFQWKHLKNLTQQIEIYKIKSELLCK